MRGPGDESPGPDMDITQIVRQKPQCFLAWQPTRPDETGTLRIDPINVCPGILIMPRLSNAKYVEEKRFDRYNNVHRPQELGQTLAVDILFSVYEPGVRLPGFIDSAESENGLDMSLFVEGTEQGLFTLTDWMDDASRSCWARNSSPRPICLSTRRRWRTACTRSELCCRQKAALLWLCNRDLQLLCRGGRKQQP